MCKVCARCVHTFESKPWKSSFVFHLFLVFISYCSGIWRRLWWEAKHQHEHGSPHMVSGSFKGAEISWGDFFFFRKPKTFTHTESLNNFQQRDCYTAIFPISVEGFFQDPHLQYGLPPMVGQQAGMKRSADGAGLDMMEQPSSDEDSSEQKPQIHSPHHDQYEDHEGWAREKTREIDLKPTNFRSYPPGAGRGKSNGPPTPHNGKKTKGRVRNHHFFRSRQNVSRPQMTIIHCYKVKIKMEFIDNKLRRYTTFSKRKTGIMKKVIARSWLWKLCRI